MAASLNDIKTKMVFLIRPMITQGSLQRVLSVLLLKSSRKGADSLKLEEPRFCEHTNHSQNLCANKIQSSVQ